MIVELKSIRRLDDGTYEVVLEEGGRAVQRPFTFTIEEGDIVVVKPPDDLLRFFGGNTAAAARISGVVMSFYRAGNLDTSA